MDVFKECATFPKVATVCNFTVSILTKLVRFVRCEQNLDGSNQTDTFEPSRPRRPLSKTVKTGNSSFFCNNATQTKNYNYVNSPINFS